MKTKITTSYDRLTFRAFDDQGDTTLRINRYSVTLTTRVKQNTVETKKKFTELQRKIEKLFTELRKTDLTNAAILETMAKEVEKI